MTGKRWFISILIASVIALLAIAGCVFWTDPFFHYRKPNESFYYILNDQRSQNDGITKHFDYDAIITGTSMAENFRASMFDELFGTNSIKVTYSGATYKEIDDNLEVAYKTGHSPRYVLRSLDYTLLVRDKGELRLDMGEYPEYLTNNNPFDDVKYLLNKDAFLRYSLPVLYRFIKGEPGGHTSFDEYSYSAVNYIYGIGAVLEGREKYGEPESILPVSDEEIALLKGNMEENVVELARKHPETTFLYFYPPYSMAYFGGLLEAGELDKELEYKKLATQMMLECDNIHVYSFTMNTDITSDLDRYRDRGHYEPSVNDWIIEKIAAEELSEGGQYINRITKENADEYFAAEKELLETFDYNKMIGK